MKIISVTIEKTTEPIDIRDLSEVKEILMPSKEKLKRLNDLGFTFQFDF